MFVLQLNKILSHKTIEFIYIIICDTLPYQHPPVILIYSSYQRYFSLYDTNLKSLA